jgi:hypothetical protein
LQAIGAVLLKHFSAAQTFFDRSESDEEAWSKIVLDSLWWVFAETFASSRSSAVIASITSSVASLIHVQIGQQGVEVSRRCSRFAQFGDSGTRAVWRFGLRSIFRPPFERALGEHFLKVFPRLADALHARFFRYASALLPFFSTIASEIGRILAIMCAVSA